MSALIVPGNKRAQRRQSRKVPTTPNEAHTEHEQDVSDSWTYLKKKLHSYDKELIENLRDELDSLLVFSGLFSAVVTAFLVESYKNLKPPDPNDPVTLLLEQLLKNQNASKSPVNNVPFQAPKSARAVNLLWLFALCTSLFVALFSILMKQWLREYMSWTDLYGQDALRIRQVRKEGFTSWRLKDKIIVVLPSLLQGSVILFVAGLVIFLAEVDETVAFAVLGFILACLAILLYTLLAPLFSYSCPYISPSFGPIRDALLYIPILALRCARAVCGRAFRRTPRRWRLRKVLQLMAYQLSEAHLLCIRTGARTWLKYDEIQAGLGSLSKSDPLNTAFGWLNVQYPDESTYRHLLHCLPSFNSLPFILDGGRKLRDGPRSLQELTKNIHSWTIWQNDVPLFYDGLTALYVNRTDDDDRDEPPKLPTEVFSLVLQLFDLSLYSTGYGEGTYTKFCILFWDLIAAQHGRKLDVHIPLPDLRRFYASVILDPDLRSCIQPSRSSFLSFIESSYRSLSHAWISPGPGQTNSTETAWSGFECFWISLLFVGDHADDEAIRTSFERLCEGVVHFFRHTGGPSYILGDKSYKLLFDLERKDVRFSPNVRKILQVLEVDSVEQLPDYWRRNMPKRGLSDDVGLRSESGASDYVDSG